VQLTPIQVNSEIMLKQDCGARGGRPTVSVGLREVRKHDRIIMSNAVVGHCLDCCTELARPIKDDPKRTR
jgi:hypothetical protein